MKKEILFCESCSYEYDRKDLRETKDGYFICRNCLKFCTTCYNCDGILYEEIKTSAEENTYCVECWNDLKAECGLHPYIDYMAIAHSDIEDRI